MKTRFQYPLPFLILLCLLLAVQSFLMAQANVRICEDVTFKSVDGMKIYGYLYRPKVSGPFPAIVRVHGGVHGQAKMRNQDFFVDNGYVVLDVDYRGSEGHGKDYRNKLAMGEKEVDDVIAGAKYLRERDDVDKKRVGLWGGSYGGYLTALGLARNSDIFAAGVDFHGVHDWSARAAGPAVPTDTPDRNRVARESSPISAVDKWKSPVLLIHGDDDRNVEFSQTVNLVRRLRANNVEFEQLIFPDEIHDFLRHQDWLLAYHAGAEFFDKHLK